MDTQPLNVKIESGQAQADLAALARALDNTGAAAGRMAAGMSTGMSKADQSIKGSMANMERFAQVAGLVNRIKINGDGVKAVADFARVLQQVARVQEIDRGKIESWSKFIQLGAQTSRLKMDMGATNALNGFVGAMNNAAKTREISAGKLQSWAKFIELGARSSQLRMGAGSMVGFNMFAQAMDNVAKSRAISASKLKSWVDFIEVAARAQHLKFDPAVSRSLLDFGRAMEGFKAPGKGSIDRLSKMFTVLASAKPIPNARAVANDLDMIAQSATRAAAALSAMPGGRFNLGGGGRRGGGGNGAAAAASPDHGPAMRGTTAGASAAGGALNTFSGGADKASKSSYTLGERLRGLNHRFDLAYQAGTIFNTMFGAFTLGGLIKGVFDASIELAKLEKAMLFATKSYEGSKQASQQFIGTVYDMGLALDQVAEPFGRFTISAGAAGVSAAQSSAIFRSVTQTLQIVGASAEQTGYAMYGLTQMVQKGKVSSEEFSRQIGEQIPGNAEAGRRALERMKGEAVTTAEFFKEMSLGKIMSTPFTALWAEELDKMFSGLREMVKDRPDVAMNRLKTSFTVFQQEIGKNGFITEVGIQFNRLAAMIGTTENGVFKLKPKFQELAQQLGQNLARMTRMAADAVAWLAENFDKVMFAGKALATLFVARTFLSWGQSAMTAIGSITSLTKALTGLSIAQKAVGGDALATGVAGAVQTASKGKTGAAAATALTGASMADIQNWRNANGIRPGRDRDADRPFAAGFGRRQGAWNPSRMTARALDAAAAASTTGDIIARRGALTAGARTASTGAALNRVTTGAANLGAAAAAAAPSALRALGAVAKAAGVGLGVVGVAAVATGAALTILSDKTTKIGQQTVQFGDILSSAMSSVSSGLGSWLSKFVSRMSGDDSQSSLDKMGRTAQAAVDALVWFGEVLGDTVGILVHFGAAIVKAVSLDMKGAREEIAQIGKDWSDNFNIDARTQQSYLATLRKANERMIADRGNEESAERGREAARQLQAQQAAQDQLRAAQLQMDAAKQMSKNMEVPTVASVMDGLRAIADGSFARANPSKTAEQRLQENIANVAAKAPVPDFAAASSANEQRYSHVTATGRHLTGGTANELAINIFNELEGRGTLRAGKSASQNTEMNRSWAIRTAEEIVNRTETLRTERTTSARRLGVVVPDQYRTPMMAAAQRNGVDPAVMASLIKAESEWKPGVAGTGGDAVGLGQFTQGTWNSVMRGRAPMVTSRNMGAADPRRNAELNLEATARYMAENNRRLQDVLKRDANAGEQYLAHFLGGGGAENLLRAMQRNPDARVSDVRGIAGQRALQNNPVFRGGSATVSEVYRWAQGKVGGSSGGAGGAMGAGGMASQGGSVADDAQSEIEKAATQRNNDWKSLQSMLALPDPASQSVARVNAVTEQLNDLKNRDEDRIKTYGEGARLVTQDVFAQIQKSYERLFRDMEDSMNPLAKANRIQAQQNDMVELALRGRGKEAEWLEKLNELKEQGYDLDLMQDEAKWAEHVNRLRTQGIDIQVESLNATRQQWELERDRTKNLEAQLRLADTINEAQLRLRAVGGRTVRDGYFAELVNSSSESGSYDEKLADLTPERLQSFNRIADVQSLSDRAESARSLVIELSDQIDTVARSGVEQRMRSTYRGVLRDLTGMSGATLAEIETALKATGDGSGKAIMDLAQTVATAREKIENPPGFKAWVDALEPFAQRMEGIKTAFLDGLSGGLTDALMGEEVEWGDIAKGLQKQVVKTQVDEFLKGGLGMLGIKQGVPPEAQAAMDAAQAQFNAAQAQIDAIAKQQRAELDGAAAAREETQRNRSQVGEQVTALRTAADALKQIAEKFDPSSYVGRLMNDTANTQLEEAMALESGNGYDAGGRPIANAALMTPARITADAGDEQLMRTVGDGSRLMADAGDEQLMRSVGNGNPGRAIVDKIMGDVNALFATASMPANDNPIALAATDAATPTAATVSMQPLYQAAEASAHAGAVAGIQAAVSAVSNDNTVTAPIAAAAQAAAPAAVASPAAITSKVMDPIMASIRSLTQTPAPAAASSASGIMSSIMGPIMGAVGSLTGGGSAPTGSAGMMSRMLGAGNDGQYNSPLSFVGEMFGKGNDLETRGSGFMKAFGLAGMIKGQLDKRKKDKVDPVYKPVNGVIGEHRSVEVTGEAVAAKANAIGSLLSTAVGIAGANGFGAPGGNLTNAMGFGSKAGIAAADAARGAPDFKEGVMGWLGRMFGGAFKEGGVSGSPAQTVSLSGYDWSSAPHYSEGTPNTSGGGMPAILHPDEAVIPLSRGRSVPVDLSGIDVGGGGGGGNVTTNVTVIAPNPDAFRKSQGAIQTQTNRNMKRSAARNLTG